MSHPITHTEALALGVLAPRVEFQWCGMTSEEVGNIPPLVMTAMTDAIRTECMVPEWEQRLYNVWCRFYPETRPLQLRVEDDAPAQ